MSFKSKHDFLAEAEVKMEGVDDEQSQEFALASSCHDVL